ncbi:MAG: hypothetical protein IJ225_05915 [Solobacterium sp.]|nr:hypothetical protein [Solobacterium sp.]
MKQPVHELLNRSLLLLEDHLPYSLEVMRELAQDGKLVYTVEQFCDNYSAIVFSYPVIEISEQVILLVYDDSGQVIADCAGIHSDLRTFLYSEALYDYLSEESDWMYLEHYVISGTMFPELPYPFCTSGNTLDEDVQGEVLLYSNAYVSRANRGQGIFSAMMELMKDFILRDCVGKRDLYTVLSLDPDVACYGPDTVDWPYVYSYERDEPIRRKNADLMNHLGFASIRLEEDEPSSESDGTKLWFVVRHEQDIVIETEEPSAV